MSEIYSVSQVNKFIKGLIDNDSFLENVSMSGEVSNVTYHPSGHIYFTVKDEESAMKGIMYRSNVPSLRFRMKEGDKVVISGAVSVYMKGGYYQIVARKIEMQGSGILYQKYLELKNELQEMGMFDPSYKQDLPKYVKRIGIVTSKSGAAVRDIIRIAKRRNPYISIILFPALVQGDYAKESIVEGIETLDKMGLDVLIVGRGGGSIEDLWAFNERIVAQAIFDCETPVISAVGHETDFTIADFVADMRAATPSEAAEKAVTLYTDTEDRLAEDMDSLIRSMEHALERNRNRLDVLTHRLNAQSPGQRLNTYKLKLKSDRDRLLGNMKYAVQSKRQAVPNQEALLSTLRLRIEAEKKRLIRDSGRLDTLSPLKKLDSGYAYPIGDDGKHIKAAGQLSAGDRIDLVMHDGIVHTVTEGVEPVDIEKRYL